MSVIAFVQSKDNVSLDEVAKDGILVTSDPDNTDTIRYVLTIKKSNIKNRVTFTQREFPRYINSEQYHLYNDYHPLKDDGGRKRIYTIFWEDDASEEMILQTARAIGINNFLFNNIRNKKVYFGAVKIKLALFGIVCFFIVGYYLLKGF